MSWYDWQLSMEEPLGSITTVAREGAVARRWWWQSHELLGLWEVPGEYCHHKDCRWLGFINSFEDGRFG